MNHLKKALVLARIFAIVAHAVALKWMIQNAPDIGPVRNSDVPRVLSPRKFLNQK